MLAVCDGEGRGRGEGNLVCVDGSDEQNEEQEEFHF